MNPIHALEANTPLLDSLSISSPCLRSGTQSKIFCPIKGAPKGFNQREIERKSFTFVALVSLACKSEKQASNLTREFKGGKKLAQKWIGKEVQRLKLLKTYKVEYIKPYLHS